MKKSTSRFVCYVVPVCCLQPATVMDVVKQACILLVANKPTQNRHNKDPSEQIFATKTQGSFVESVVYTHKSPHSSPFSLYNSRKIGKKEMWSLSGGNDEQSVRSLVSSNKDPSEETCWPSEHSRHNNTHQESTDSLLSFSVVEVSSDEERSSCDTMTATNVKDAMESSPTDPLIPLLRQSSSAFTTLTCNEEASKDADNFFSKRPTRKVGWRHILLVVILVSFSPFCMPSLRSAQDHFSDNCVFVSGGGFSGYFFLLGRLHNSSSSTQSLLQQQEFVCYSAGCLSVASFLMGQSGDQALALAKDAQRRYLEGSIPWLNATEQMIINTVRHKKRRTFPRNAKFLRRMHIMTTTYDRWGWFFVWPRLTIRTPTTMDELEHMMVQTTLIPFVTGSSWTRNGHNDGVFMPRQHPSCPHSVAITYDLDIYLNAANVLMPAKRAMELYKRGRALGTRFVFSK